MRVDVYSYAVDPHNPILVGSAVLVDQDDVGFSSPAFQAFVEPLYIPGPDLEPLTPADGEQYLLGLAAALTRDYTRATVLSDEDQQEEMYA